MLYAPILKKEDTENAVVGEGNLFLFSEDGDSLSAKMPDGSYKSLGGGILKELNRNDTTSPSIEVGGKIRYVFKSPLDELALTSFKLASGGSSISSPYEAEFQFQAGAGFRLKLPEDMFLAAGRGISGGFVADAYYILNVRFGVAVIARIYPGGVGMDDGKLVERIAALEQAVTGVEANLADIIGEE